MPGYNTYGLNTFFYFEKFHENLKWKNTPVLQSKLFPPGKFIRKQLRRTVDLRLTLVR